MQSVSAFIRVVYFSFFSVDFYHDVYNNLQGKQLSYLLRVSASVALIMMLIESAVIWNNFAPFNITNKTIEHLSDRIPVMIIKNGELHIENKTSEKPVYIRDSDGAVIFIIDDHAKDNIYHSEHAMIVIVKNGFSLSNSDLISFNSLLNKNEVVITHEVLMQYWEKAFNTFRIVLPIVVCIMAFVGLAIKTIVYVMFFSLLVLLLHKTLQYNTIKFESLFRLGVFASIPAMILYIPLFFIPLVNTVWVYFVYFILVYSKVIFPKTLVV